MIACLSASPWHGGKGDARERMLATRASDCSAALVVLQPGRRPGRAGLRRPLGGVRRDRQPSWRARSQFAPDLVIADIDPGISMRRRLREPLLRRLPQRALRESGADRCRADARVGAPAAPQLCRPAWPRGRGLDWLGHRDPGLRRQERVPGRRDRPLGRHRLGADGSACRRGPRCRRRSPASGCRRCLPAR